MAEAVSLVKALKDYFGDHPGGLRFIAEFQALTTQDKADLREMLIAEGYDIAPLAA
jgi:hypothetical protein